MNRRPHILCLAVALHVSACGYDTGLVEVDSVCAAIIDGTVSDLERSTVKVSGGCTGVLIAPTVVLTAAHCGNPAWVEASGVVRSNINYVPHPEYDSDGAINDLALLFLDGTIPDMVPVVIGWPTYGEALIQGYGVDESNESGILKEGTTNVVAFFDEHKLGTDPSGSDSCFGDSGGPMYQRGLLVAIVTSGYPGAGDNARASSCGEGGLYTIPALYQAWLTSEVEEVTFTGKCSG